MNWPRVQDRSATHKFCRGKEDPADRHMPKWVVLWLIWNASVMHCHNFCVVLPKYPWPPSPPPYGSNLCRLKYVEVGMVTLHRGVFCDQLDLRFLYLFDCVHKNVCNNNMIISFSSAFPLTVPCLIILMTMIIITIRLIITNRNI